MAGPTKAGAGIGYGLRSVVRGSLATLLATTALGVVAAHAVDGTWAGGSSDWTDPTNWTSNPSVPDGTAIFSTTGSTAVDNNNGVVTIGTIQFAGTSQAYTFTIGNPFIVNATGIVNADTVNTQTFEVTAGNNLVFQNSSTASGGAGAVTITNDVGGNVNFIQNSTAGTASLTNSGFITFEDSASAGTAQITNNATGQIDFFTSASAGSATINNVAGGVVNFHNSTTAGTSTITNDGTLTFDGSATAGSASITTNAGGTVDISGLSSAGMTAGSIAGAGDYVLGAKTLTTGGNNVSTQVDGVISGAGGGLTKVGTGTLTLTGTNTYSGATTISAGTLAISAFGSISSSSVVTVDATFDISASSVPFNAITTLAGSSSGVVNMGANGLVITNGSTEFAGVIQGTGGLEVFGGTQTLSGANTYGGPTQIDAGATLALKGSGSIASSLFIGFAGAGATLDISQTTSGASVTQLFSFGANGVVALGSKTLTITAGNSFGGVIQDGGIGGGTGGNLVIANGAVQQLYGVNTYTGTTTIASGGELDLVNSGGSDGRIATSSNVIASGIFDITALSTGTSIKSLSGSGNVNLGANTLTITNGNGTFAGVIDDGAAGGGLALTSGAQTLTGVNTYTGATTVNGGTLVVDGSLLSSPATVNAGGTLAGSGAVASVLVNGGTLAPGSASNPFGPLTVNGPLTFTAASTYMVQVSSTNASLTNVAGAAADLGGATVRANFASGMLQKKYTILNATGGLGGTTFNAAVVSNMPTVSATLSYDPNNVFLNVNVNFAQAGGLNVNQQNVASTLANFFNTTGGIPAAFAALTPAGLTTASGEARHRHHPVGDQCRRPVPEPDARPDRRRTQRRLRQGRQRRPVCRERQCSRLCVDAAGHRARARGLCDGHQGTAAVIAAQQPLERMVGRLWRFGRGRRQRAGRLAGSHRAGLGRRGRRRLPALGRHAGRLCARRRRTELLARQCAGVRLGRPVPGGGLWPA